MLIIADQRRKGKEKMAFIFKRKRTKVVNGKKVKKQSQKWYVRLTDADGIKRTIPLFTDKAASQQRAAELAKEIEQAKAGLIDRYKEHRKRPLSKHLQEFRESLLNKGTTQKQAHLAHNRAKAVIDNCKFVYVSDISGSKAQKYLAARRRSGLSIRSSNFYLQAIKQLLNWMVADGRTGENPLAYLKGQNPKKDIRHARRALTLEEINAVLTVTLAGRKHHNLTGKQRYMLYLLALTTGLRAKELASVTWRRLNLSESGPCITVLIAYAKNDREVTLPLRKDVADEFRRWLAEGDFSLNDKVFPRFNENKGAEILRKDLECAGVSYQDESGRFADFHSFRHSFCTQVIQSGATAKEAQALARHSTSALTLDVYAHVGLYDERRAVERLPKLHIDSEDSAKNRSIALKTGTDNQPVNAVGNGSRKLTPKLTPKVFFDNDQSATIDSKRVSKEALGDNGKSLKTKTLGNKSDSLSPHDTSQKQQAAGGFEPPNNGFANRRLRPLGYAATNPVFHAPVRRKGPLP